MKVSPYIAREMARLHPKPHPIGVGRCERCIWRAGLLCANEKSPRHNLIVASRDGCLKFEEK